MRSINCVKSKVKLANFTKVPTAVTKAYTPNGLSTSMALRNKDF